MSQAFRVSWALGCASARLPRRRPQAFTIRFAEKMYKIALLASPPFANTACMTGLEKDFES